MLPELVIHVQDQYAVFSYQIAQISYTQGRVAEMMNHANRRYHVVLLILLQLQEIPLAKCDVLDPKQFGLLPRDPEARLRHVDSGEEGLGKLRSQSQNALARPATTVKKRILRYFRIIDSRLGEQHMN